MDGNIGLFLLLIVAIIGLLEVFFHIHAHIRVMGAILVIVVITGYIFEVW